MFQIFIPGEFRFKSLFQVIAADGEMRASKALRKVNRDDDDDDVDVDDDISDDDDEKSREASSVIEQSPAAMQLRYLQTLNSISSGSSSCC